MGPSYRRSARFSNKQPTQGESALGHRDQTLAHQAAAYPPLALSGPRALRTDPEIRPLRDPFATEKCSLSAHSQIADRHPSYRRPEIQLDFAR
jgi:hypothetical protein